MHYEILPYAFFKLYIYIYMYIYIYNVVISSIYIISIYTNSYICSYKFHSSETFKLWPIYLTLCVITCLPRQERLLLTIQHSTIIGPIKHNCYCCSVSKLCPTLCDPMNYSTPGFSVLCFLPEFAQTYVYWYYPTVSSVATLSSCPQSFQASGSLFMY